MNRQHAVLLDRIKESGKEFRDYLSRLPASEINRVPGPGEWSIHAVAAHLRDTEEHAFLERVRRILNEAEPPQVPNFDQVEWNRLHYSAEEPLDQILADFRKARRQLLRLLGGVPDKRWSSYAIHPEYGKISLEWIATHNYAHTLEHLHQLLELREQAILRELN